MKSSLVKFTTAAAMIGTLAVAIATTSEPGRCGRIRRSRRLRC